MLQFSLQLADTVGKKNLSSFSKVGQYQSCFRKFITFLPLNIFEVAEVSGDIEVALGKEKKERNDVKLLQLEMPTSKIYHTNFILT